MNETDRAERIAKARDAAVAWAWWCYRMGWGAKGGRPPSMVSGGMERQFRPPPQWHPPEPSLPEADENLGLAVQRAYIRLPGIYRQTLNAEFCLRPWVIPGNAHDLEVWLARRARVSIGAYKVTVERALLAMANQMSRQGTWKA